MSRDRHTVAKNIKQIVKVFPEATTNYNYLHYLYWTLVDHVEDVKDIIEATPAETIRRTFQKLIQQGELKVPKHVLEARKQKEVEYRHEFSKLY